jgi:hypothetical protein
VSAALIVHHVGARIGQARLDLRRIEDLRELGVQAGRGGGRHRRRNRDTWYVPDW